MRDRFTVCSECGQEKELHQDKDMERGRQRDYPVFRESIQPTAQVFNEVSSLVTAKCSDYSDATVKDLM